MLCIASSCVVEVIYPCWPCLFLYRCSKHWTPDVVVQVPRPVAVETLRQVPVPQVQTVEKILEVPQVQCVEQLVQVPQVTVQGPDAPESTRPVPRHCHPGMPSGHLIPSLTTSVLAVFDPRVDPRVAHRLYCRRL